MTTVDHTAATADVPALEARDIRRVYGGTVALAGVDLEVRAGEIHGLLGENGAGKSTLVRILAGLERPDGGVLAIGGRTVGGDYDSVRAAQSGCAFIHQETGLVDDLSIADNVALVAGFPRRFGLVNQAAVRRQARRALEAVGLTDLDVDLPVGTLPLATRAVVAIARALVHDASVLVLDEPTAALHASEVRVLFDLLNRLSESGVACVLITHRIDEVLAHCHRVTVLRNGRVVGVEMADRLDEDALMDLIVGAGAAVEHAAATATTAAGGAPVLTVRSLTSLDVGPADLTVRAGEIVGLTGLADSGARALGDLLFGIEQPVTGSVCLPDGPFRPASPAAAIARRVAMVPADRGRAGVASTLTLGENVRMNPTRKPWQPLRPATEKAATERLLRAHDVRPPEPDRELSTLSGGNQQKVVLAKWLSAEPVLLVLDEPTAAVDIGAKRGIHRMLRRQADDGVAVVLISSDFEEIAAVCDRALVLARGRIAAELAGPHLEVGSITRAAYGTEWEATA